MPPKRAVVRATSQPSSASASAHADADGEASRGSALTKRSSSAVSSVHSGKRRKASVAEPSSSSADTASWLPSRTASSSSAGTASEHLGSGLWFLKSDADFLFRDLEQSPQQTHMWDGVRNHQAKNFIRRMQLGDRALFYESGDNAAVVGIVTISREPYPDHTAWTGPHRDPKSTADCPIWYMVDVTLEKRLAAPVSLKEIKSRAAAGDRVLATLPFLRQPRLSVMPLSRDQFEALVALGNEPH